LSWGWLSPEELLGMFRHLEKGVSEVKLRQTVQMGGETKHFRSFHVRTSEDGVENGTETGYAGICTDVTLEAEAVIGAAQTEARFQDIIRSASEWVWETDVDLNLTYVSSRISETLEMPLRSVVGRNIFALGVFENSGDGLRGKPDLVKERSADASSLSPTIITGCSAYRSAVSRFIRKGPAILSGIAEPGRT
jgi:PAS domain-containing protein